MTKSWCNVGPFTDKKGNILTDEPVEVLQSHYESLWKIPKEEYIIRDRDTFFKEGTEKPTLKYIHYYKFEISKAIYDHKMDPSPGLDGILPYIF